MNLIQAAWCFDTQFSVFWVWMRMCQPKLQYWVLSLVRSISMSTRLWAVNSLLSKSYSIKIQCLIPSIFELNLSVHYKCVSREMTQHILTCTFSIKKESCSLIASLQFICLSKIMAEEWHPRDLSQSTIQEESLSSELLPLNHTEVLRRRRKNFFPFLAFYSQLYVESIWKLH